MSDWQYFLLLASLMFLVLILLQVYIFFSVNFLPTLAYPTLIYRIKSQFISVIVTVLRYRRFAANFQLIIALK